MIGIVADDITGANDIGTMFSKAGYLTHVYPFEAFDPSAASAAAERPDVVILDTASRLDAPEIAYGKVENATKRLKAAGAALWINKTCSVFRGNVGAEFDAMLDALGVSFAVVVLGFPKNGRTTVDGMHYVRGLPLERSEFRNDPVHPMTTSSLVDILRGQTKRRVERLGERTAGLTPEGLRARLEEAESRGGYVILDVESQDDLRTIALAVRDDYVLCGSSALSEELALTLPGKRGGAQAKPLPLVEGVGILCAAGSLMPQTAGQIDYLKEKGVPIFEMDTLRLFSPHGRGAELERLADTLVGVLRAGSHAAVHSTNDPARVAETKRIGATLGMTGEQVSRLVSDALADVASAVMARTGQNRLVTAGGETSASICDKLGVSGMKVWKEIEPGVPSCITLSEEPLMLVLKSGSFGKPSFLYDALQHLLEP
ncbi:four-carbon acid sugar kinase family protein [Paenibacillus sp.]|uniref:four-carbon acid sugar kinase family protein n=1 Tax=Paenibacillus sp. TaxID=58172 RepID=UPI002810E656|nr:four-carbon acid sugar kinase family protein [Paenibacillus sp.]